MENVSLSPHASALLAAVQFQGQTNNCGPYSTATVINAICGKNLQGDQLADEMAIPVWRGALLVVRRIPNWATFPWGIVDELNQNGLHASWQVFASADQLIDGLQKGDILMPIIGSWKPMFAHVMTLVAHSFDDNQTWGFANTAVQGHDIFWMADNDFQTKWSAMGRILVHAKPGA